MTKVVHPENAIYPEEGDKKTLELVDKISALILSLREGHKRDIFAKSQKYIESPIKNLEQINLLLKVIVVILREDIETLIAESKVNMGAEMLAHMALSRMDI